MLFPTALLQIYKKRLIVCHWYCCKDRVLSKCNIIFHENKGAVIVNSSNKKGSIIEQDKDR